MGIRGRKPTPTALKVIQGNPGHRPLNKNEPKVEPGIPERPKWLKGEAKKEWDRVIALFGQTGVITPIDGSMLAVYCCLFAEWVNSIRGKCPPMTASRIAQMRALASSFGLDPSSRSRISGKDKSKSNKWGALV